MTSPAIVVGASRGLGHGIATALTQNGVKVIGVARTGEVTVAADATDPAVGRRLLAAHQPGALVLVAGATPEPAPLHQQTWESFSANWEVDVQLTFNWVSASLTLPLAPGTRVIVISSGAALRGSPLSGGYAGAKATQRFIAAYAQEEANRAGLGISFTTILPAITPMGGVGRPAISAYANRLGVSEAEYLGAGPPLTPEVTGAAVVELLGAAPSALAAAYRLIGDGLQPLP